VRERGSTAPQIVLTRRFVLQKSVRRQGSEKRAIGVLEGRNPSGARLDPRERELGSTAVTRSAVILIT
jgi:hypothetical protein